MAALDPDIALPIIVPILVHPVFYIFRNAQNLGLVSVLHEERRAGGLEGVRYLRCKLIPASLLESRFIDILNDL